jgi:hypothetical protein
MSDFAYQQPPAQMDPFFTYDQALPFSPSAQQFDQPFAMPASRPIGMGQQHQQYGTSMGMYGVDPNAFAGLELYPQHQQQQQAHGGGPTLPAYPQSAKWDASFQPGGEGLPFDETLLGDFGAALLQAEEMGVW